jgi:hypothetical protein
MLSLYSELLSCFLRLTSSIVEIKEANDGVLFRLEIILLLILECGLLGLGVNYNYLRLN